MMFNCSIFFIIHNVCAFVFVIITEHFEDIVALLFKYIHLLQQSGPCQWIFDEV